MSHRIDLGLNAVIVAVTDEVPRILTVRRPRNRSGPDGPTIEDALPFGPLDPVTDPTLERGLRRWVHEQTGLELGYVEQLYTFGDRLRDPVEAKTGGRSVSVAYLALVRERPGRGSGEARWGDIYGFLPWEDWREGRPEDVSRVHARAEAPRLLRGGLVHLHARHLPAERLRDSERAARAATHVEVAALPAPRGAVPLDAPEQQRPRPAERYYRCFLLHAQSGISGG